MWTQNQPAMSRESDITKRNGDRQYVGNRSRTPDKIPHQTFERDQSILPKLLNFFGLTQQPFGVTPDPSFLYLSRTHREALASLVYGIESGRGFLALIAKPGMGKTTLLFHLLERFRTSARTAFLFQTQCTSREFMQFLISELGHESGNSQDFVRMHEEFNHYLLQEARAGKQFIVVVDEAQNLDSSVLETVRLLSNFETPRAKLVQIILAGQPDLEVKLANRDMVQLRQRLSLLNRLEPFCAQEIEQYIQHRLRISGYGGKSLLTSEALTMLIEFAEGIPRNVNNFCFSAMSLAFALKSPVIDTAIAREVINDLDISRHSFRPRDEAEVRAVAQTSDVTPVKLPDIGASALTITQTSVGPGSIVPEHLEATQTSAPVKVQDGFTEEPAQPSELSISPLSNKADPNEAELVVGADVSVPIKPQHVDTPEAGIGELNLSQPLAKQNRITTAVMFADQVSTDIPHELQDACIAESAKASELNISQNRAKSDSDVTKIAAVGHRSSNTSIKSQDLGIPDLATANGNGRNMTLAEAVAYLNELARSLKPVGS